MLAYVEAFEALHSEAPSLCMWLKNFMKIIMTDTNCNSANKNSVQLARSFIIVKVDCHLLKIFEYFERYLNK